MRVSRPGVKNPDSALVPMKKIAPRIHDFATIIAELTQRHATILEIGVGDSGLRITIRARRVLIVSQRNWYYIMRTIWKRSLRRWCVL